jgi:large subunit ribosomal protein L34e
MTDAKYRSRSWKRKKVRRGEKIKVIYKRERIIKSRCICGRLLPGVKTVGNVTKKRVSRPYGGRLCTKCTRRLMIESARGAK